MPRKYIKYVVLFIILISLGFVFRVTRFDRIVYLDLNPDLFDSRKHLSLDFRSNMPKLSFGEPGIYDENTELTYGGEAYDHWYGYLSSSDAETEAYWDNWNWKDKVVQLHTRLLDAMESRADFNIIQPGIINSNDVLKEVKVTCRPESTFILSKNNLGIVATDVDPLAYLSVGSILYTYCNDFACSSVGNNFCAIIPNE